MTTQKQAIADEFLSAVDDPAGLEAVFQRHRGSKGPLYLGLAQATSALTERFLSLSEKVRTTERGRQEKQEQINSMNAGLVQLQQERDSLTSEIQDVNTRLEQAKGLVDQANVLAGLGFGLPELRRLRELLAQVAAAQGFPPEEGVAEFFETVSRYEQVISLELESKRAEARADQAKAELEGWEADVRRKESQSRARIATIDLVQRWLAAGIKEKDLPRWDKLLQKAQIGPDAVTEALRKYGSAEVACQKKAQQTTELQEQIRKAEARLGALQREEAQVKAGIIAIRDGGLNQINNVSQETQKHLATLLAKAQEYGELQRQAGQLENMIAVARALKTDDAEQWAAMPRSMVRHLLFGLMCWANTGDRNQEVVPPEAVSKKHPIFGLSSVRLVDLLHWVLVGVLTEEERKLFLGSR